MSTKYWDIKTDTPKTEQEAWERWSNRMQSELATLPYTKRTKIEVKYNGPFRLSDFRSGDHYLDAEGSRISKAEAMEEVDWLNEHGARA